MSGLHRDSDEEKEAAPPAQLAMAILRQSTSGRYASVPDRGPGLPTLRAEVANAAPCPPRRRQARHSDGRGRCASPSSAMHEVHTKP